jgi:hypothetical protein
MSRLLGGLGPQRRTFIDRVEAYRRGTPQDQRARDEALRCADGVWAARQRLQHMAQHMTEGGLETSIQFRPLVYKVSADSKGRKFGVAEMQGAIILSARTASGAEMISLPFIISTSLRKTSVFPHIAELPPSAQQNHIVRLFLRVAERSGNADEHVFCDRLENALAHAVAARRILT